LISGTDIFSSFHKWKNYKTILDFYSIYVYPRPGSGLGDFTDHPKIKLNGVSYLLPLKLYNVVFL